MLLAKVEKKSPPAIEVDEVSARLSEADARVAAAMARVAELEAEEQQALFSGTASAFYRLVSEVAVAPIEDDGADEDKRTKRMRRNRVDTAELAPRQRRRRQQRRDGRRRV